MDRDRSRLQGNGWGLERRLQPLRQGGENATWEKEQV